MKKTKLILAALAIACVVAIASLAACATSEPSAQQPADQPQAQAVDTTADKDSPYVNDETCLSCHGGSYEAVAALTADYEDSNPHNSIHGGYDSCDTCHAKGSEVADNHCMFCHDWPRDLDSNPYN